MMVDRGPGDKIREEAELNCICMDIGHTTTLKITPIVILGGGYTTSESGVSVLQGVSGVC